MQRQPYSRPPSTLPTSTIPPQLPNTSGGRRLSVTLPPGIALMSDNKSTQVDQLSHMVGQLDLTTISQVKEYVEKVITTLSNPSIPLAEWRRKPLTKVKHIPAIARGNLGIGNRQSVAAVAKNSGVNGTGTGKTVGFGVGVGVGTSGINKRVATAAVPLKEKKTGLVPVKLTSYKQILEGSVEYVALFRANRPAQSDVSMLPDIRITEEIYEELLDEVRSTIYDIKSKYKGNLSMAIKTLSGWLTERLEYVKKIHMRQLDTVKSAFKSRLTDALCRVVHSSRLQLKEKLKNVEKEHEENLKNLDEEIFNAKKDAYKKSYEISKLRTHVARYQLLLRKQGITENEDYFQVDDEKIRTEDVMEHYQNLLIQKEDKIKEMITQLIQLEDLMEMQFWGGAGAGGSQPPQTSNSGPWQVQQWLDASSTGGQGQSQSQSGGDQSSQDIINTSQTVSGSRKSSIAQPTLTGRPITSAKGARIVGSNDIDGTQSLNESMASLGNSVSSINNQIRSGPPSRMTQSRKTYFSDLTSVVERNLDGASGRQSRISGISGAGGNGEDPFPSEPQTAGGKLAGRIDEKEQGYRALTEEEIVDITAQVREAYEQRLKESQEEILTMMASERAEISRMNREFRERFEELTNDISRDQQIMQRLKTDQMPVREHVRVLFPYGVLPGRKNMGVQCNIEMAPVDPATKNQTQQQLGVAESVVSRSAVSVVSASAQ
ncbi:hypothetical protein HDU76_007787 [Blyttiomyces sp. JEL0837]|nr:hypothetical protein HDU76_007787 [Blyttiomyces sp. JEL0837]